jgi:hypothetical protein
MPGDHQILEHGHFPEHFSMLKCSRNTVSSGFMMLDARQVAIFEKQLTHGRVVNTADAV